MKHKLKSGDKALALTLIELAVNGRITGLKEALEIIEVCGNRADAIAAIRERVQNIRNHAERQKREFGSI